MHRVLLCFLLSFVLAFAPNLAHAASPDGVANTESFQKGEEFSIGKAMNIIFGNVDEHNKSRFESYTFTAVEGKAFTLNNVETMYLATSGELLNLLNGDGGNANPAFTPYIGFHIFEKINDRWELFLSDKYLTEAEGVTSVDLVKIGQDQVALAVTDGLSDHKLSERWTMLYSLVGGQIKEIFRENVYDDNQGACSMERGPGEVYTGSECTCEEPEEGRAAIPNTCHSFKTDIYVFSSDSKFYTLKTITTDTIEWKDSDGKRLPPKSLESYLQFEDQKWHKFTYVEQLSIPTTEPMVPLFDEDSNYKKRRQSLEKSARRIQ